MHPISVCIIAKNEERRIEKCLASVKPCGFEIIVVDTGSTDRTKEIAARYADKVLDFAWCDDFSAARNYSLQAASNNWIFMLDCDEWIEHIDVEELNYFRKRHADSVGAVTRKNLVTQDGRYVLNNTDNTERFFNRKLYRYAGIIHEQLVPIRGREFPCLLLHTEILHTGYDMTPEEQIAKGRRNLTLLHRQLEQEPENPYVYYQLGKGYEIVEDYQAACDWYGKGLYFDVDPSLAYVQAMVVSYGNALLRTGQAQTALGFEQIYDEFAVSPDFVYLMGCIYEANNLCPQAIEQYHRALSMPEGKLHGVNSFLSRYRIASICERCGDLDNALVYYRMCGDFPPAAERLTQLSQTARGQTPLRIALFGSDLYILQYIMEQYERAFRDMGCETFVFPPAATQETFAAYAEKLFLFREQGLDAVVTFNNRGFRMPFSDRGSLWDLWNVPCFNVLVDHPMYYYDTLDECPGQGIVVCSDRNHVKYVERFCPAVHRALFLPTGGAELPRAQGRKPIAERSIDVLFIGSYKYHADYAYDALDEAVMDDLILRPGRTYEAALEARLRLAQPDVSEDALRRTIEAHRFVETNLCAMYRAEILRALTQAGIRVTVYGEGWEHTDLPGQPGFDCHAPVSFEDGLALMADSRIVLNQMAWFKDGGSERIFNAMLQGAVSLTDDSLWLREQFTDGEDLVFYALAALEELPRTAAALLGDPGRMQRIADNGYAAAAACHTWAHRAAELAQSLQNRS